MKAPFESVMGLTATITCSVVGLQQLTQKPGVPSTLKTKNKKTDPAGRKFYLIREDEGYFPESTGSKINV